MLNPNNLMVDNKNKNWFLIPKGEELTRNEYLVTEYNGEKLDLVNIGYNKDIGLKPCVDYVLQYLKQNCDLNTWEEKLKSTYPTLIKKQSNIIEVINDFYISEEEYQNLKNNGYAYIIKNLPQLLMLDIGINTQYIYV